MAKKKLVLSARLEAEYIQALDEVARSQHITRSQLLREFARNATTLYDLLKAVRERQQMEKIAMDKELSQWVLENTPEPMSSELMHFLGEVMHHAAAMKEAQEKEREK